MTAAVYLTRDWRTFRARFLKAHPACSIPGCRTAATHVDHIRSIRTGGEIFDPTNCQALCQQHHNAKTARVDRPDRRRNMAPVRASGCDVDGWPLAPEHPWAK